MLINIFHDIYILHHYKIQYLIILIKILIENFKIYIFDSDLVWRKQLMDIEG